MRPAAEALAQTIDVMLERRGDGGDEVMALELESRIIVSGSLQTHTYLIPVTSPDFLSRTLGYI